MVFGGSAPPAASEIKYRITFTNADGEEDKLNTDREGLIPTPVLNTPLGIKAGTKDEELSSATEHVYFLGRGHNSIYRVIPQDDSDTFIRKKYHDLDWLKDDVSNMERLRDIADDLDFFFDIPSSHKDPSNEDSMILGDTEGRPFDDVLDDPNFPEDIKHILLRHYEKYIENLQLYLRAHPEYEVSRSTIHEKDEEERTTMGSFGFKYRGKEGYFFIKDLDVIVTQKPNGELALVLVDAS